jgi:hypothetical protein
LDEPSVGIVSEFLRKRECRGSDEGRGLQSILLGDLFEKIPDFFFLDIHHPTAVVGYFVWHGRVVF